MPLGACRDSRNARFSSTPRVSSTPRNSRFSSTPKVSSTPRSSSFSSTPRVPRNTRNPTKAYVHKKANPYFSLAFLAYSNSEEGKWQYPVGFLSR